MDAPWEEVPIGEAQPLYCPRAPAVIPLDHSLYPTKKERMRMGVLEGNRRRKACQLEGGEADRCAFEFIGGIALNRMCF